MSDGTNGGTQGYAVIAYLSFLFIALVWCSLIVATPLLASLGDGYANVSALLYLFFSFTCHQLPQRSFHLFGHKLAVCARCTAIYFGGLLAALAYPIVRRLGDTGLPSKWIVILSIIPIGLDGVSQALGLRESTNTLRALTGFMFGFVLPFYLIPAYVEVTKTFTSLLQGIMKR